MVGECEMMEYLSGGECHALRTEDPAHLNSSGCLNVDKDKVQWTSALIVNIYLTSIVLL